MRLFKIANTLNNCNKLKILRRLNMEDTRFKNFEKLDTIPPSIKKLFYADKTMPNLTKDYDAIGFDADHCFVKYRIVELTKLIGEMGLKELHKTLGYPKEILDFDFNSKELEYCLNYSVFDVDRGLLIQLGEGKVVLNAMKGRRRLT